MLKERNQILIKIFLDRHTIPSVASSRSLFEPRLGSPETLLVSHLSKEGQCCRWCKLCWATRTSWDWCEPSLLRRRHKAQGTVRSRRCAQPFPLNYCHSGCNRACPLCTPWSPRRWGATHSEKVARWAIDIARSWHLFLFGVDLSQRIAKSSLKRNWSNLFHKYVTVKGHWIKDACAKLSCTPRETTPHRSA